MWALVGIVAEAIWKGVEVAAKVTLIALQWSVKYLWFLVTKVYNGLRAVGSALYKGFTKTIGFFRHDFVPLLKRGWTKFWKFVDSTETWLKKTFGPTLTWLKALRDHLLQFWKTYVQPWLDLIDVTRRVLRVLGSFGLKWARELERRLAEIEDRITAPFLLVLRKVNEVIGIVDRIVGADGLFQRLYFIRTIQRDYDLLWKALRAPYHHPLDSRDLSALVDTNKLPPFSETEREVFQYLATGTGQQAAYYDELIRSVVLSVRGSR